MNDSKNELKRSPGWVRGGVATFMALWAAGQLFVVQTQGLSSWRGGGFGMYGGFHPVQNDAWVRREGQPTYVRFWKNSDDDSELFKTVRPHLTFPREQQLARSLENLSGEDRGRYEVEITALAFDLDSLVLSRRSLLKITAGGKP